MMSEENDPLQGFLSQESERAKELFLRAIRFDFTLHLLFWSLLFLEALAIALLLSLDPVSWWMALSGALFLFTLFSYLSLKVYFTSRKKDRFDDIEKKYIESLRRGFDGEGISIEERRFVSQALIRSSRELEGEEYKVFKSRFSGKRLAVFFWHDLFSIRESLLRRAIEEEIERVKISPLHPDLHISLANAHVLIGDLYKNEKRGGKEFQGLIKARFLEATKRALLEFKILRQYDPKDPWILFQLAYTFGDLGQADEELQAYEEASRLRPHDLDALQKLGSLYFQSGRALEGLEIYDQLRKVDRERAEELISFY